MENNNTRRGLSQQIIGRAGVSLTLAQAAQQPVRFTPDLHKHHRGFTLIELLVVVLIIGILAAVALPQYNKTIYRAQVTEALQFMNYFDKELASYYLENGNYQKNTGGYGAVHWNDLGINPPALNYFQIGSSSNPPYSAYNYYLTHHKAGLHLGANLADGKLLYRYCSVDSNALHPNCADLFSYCSAPEKRSQQDLQIGCKEWHSYCVL